MLHCCKTTMNNIDWFNDIEHLKLQQEGFDLIFFSSFTTRSRGVAIMFRNNVTFKMSHCIKDKGGRYLIVKGELYGETIAIMNVYYPPGQPSNFLAIAFSELSDLNVKNPIIAGDFNCNLNPCIDKFPIDKVSFLTNLDLLMLFVRTWIMWMCGELSIH